MNNEQVLRYYQKRYESVRLLSSVQALEESLALEAAINCLTRKSIDINTLAKVTSKVLNIHEEPISNKDAQVELTMGELLEIVKEFQETYPFSEEDMIEFSSWCYLNGYSKHQINDRWYDGEDYIGNSKELLQLWKAEQPKISL